MKMNIAVKMEFKIPSTPNFIQSETGTTLAVSEFSEEQLRQIGDLWTRELIEKAKKQKHASKN